MFKIFGVSEDGTQTEKMEIKSLETRHEKGSEIAISESEATNHDTDIGQIAVDILDLDDAIVIIAPIAGVDMNDIDIKLSRNILTISGERIEDELYSNAKRMLVEECFYGAFSRSIILPENLGFDKIYASIHQNVLTISLPKLTISSKTVPIHSK